MHDDDNVKVWVRWQFGGGGGCKNIVSIVSVRNLFV